MDNLHNFQSQDFGHILYDARSNRLDYSEDYLRDTSEGGAPQKNNVPQHWTTLPNSIGWNTGFYSHDTLSNNLPAPDSYVYWSGTTVPATQVEGLDYPGTYTVREHTMSDATIVAPEMSYNATGFIGMGMDRLDSAGEAIGIVPSVPTAQQAQPVCDLRECPLCPYPSQPSYTTQEQYRTHMQTAHPTVITCDLCTFFGRSQWDLDCHTCSTGRASIICEHDGCEKSFSRLDTYQRHQRIHRKDVKRFPCKYCKKYRGEKGFKRKDHLNQHVRSYHHIDEGQNMSFPWGHEWCPKKECIQSKPEGTTSEVRVAFASTAAYYGHMRAVHNESEFPCPHPGCDRIKGKGYFRQVDLRAHRRKVHGTDGSSEHYRPL